MLWVQRTVCGPLFRSLELRGQRAVGRVSVDRKEELERTGGGRILIESVGPWGDDVRAGDGLESS